MEKHRSAVCALILALGAFVHFNTVAAGEGDQNFTGKFVWNVKSAHLLFPFEKCMFVCPWGFQTSSWSRVPQLIFLFFCFIASFSQWLSQNQAIAHVALMLSHRIKGVCVMKTVLQTTNAVSLTVELSVSLRLSVRATMLQFYLKLAAVEYLVKCCQWLNRRGNQAWAFHKKRQSPTPKPHLSRLSVSHVHTLTSLSLQQSQACVLAGAGALGCALNFVPATATVLVMRNAATMDVDTSALHHTQVRSTKSWKRPL